MTERHIHADMIHAWADGAEIEFRDRRNGRWVETSDPIWAPDIQYRIKPKEQFVKVRLVEWKGGVSEYNIFPCRESDWERVSNSDNFLGWVSEPVEIKLCDLYKD